MNATNDAGSPLYQEEDVSAAHMAAELLVHLEEIKALNWEPATNRKELAEHRSEALAILEALNAHMAFSGSIAAPKPAQSVRCYCGVCSVCKEEE